jgi:acyl phosphate:glycerol-3-phosphate acyltransferase
MDFVLTILLAAGAFLLGAVPFAVLIGHRVLHKDITAYGDGNPGAANVFRAGNIKTGLLAVLLDVAKGVPFVLVSHTAFGLPPLASVFIGIAAVLGHAYSPFLHWRGGKAIAVTYGVMLGLPSLVVLLSFVIFMLIGLIVMKSDAWTVILGAAGAFIYLLITRGYAWEPLMALCLLIILAVKHFEALRNLPGFRFRLSHRLETR